MKDQGANLLDRERELEAIAAAVNAGRQGQGVLAVLEGSAGAGKSALLGVAAETGSVAGMRVLSARGGNWSRDSRSASSDSCTSLCSAS